MNNTAIYHYGVKGMKWGVRRTQNSSNSVTPKKRPPKNNTSPKKGTTKNKQKSGGAGSALSSFLSGLSEGYRNSTTSATRVNNVTSIYDRRIQKILNSDEMSESLKKVSIERLQRGRQIAMMSMISLEEMD